MIWKDFEGNSPLRSLTGRDSAPAEKAEGVEAMDHDTELGQPSKSKSGAESEQKGPEGPLADALNCCVKLFKDQLCKEA